MIHKPRVILFSLLVFVIVLIGVSYFVKKNAKPEIIPQPTPFAEEQKKITLAIDFGSESTLFFDYSFSEEKSAYDALKETLEKEKISYEIQQYDFGVFVKSIDGKESSADMAWIYFVNGEAGQVAADQTKINSGDSIEWRYIKPE